ncbi:MAG: phosphatidylserine decarboxylase [Solobacterium sp.]|nr:phosphatidylserine decarboxylase [Solobacterium sp.]
MNRKQTRTVTKRFLLWLLVIVTSLGLCACTADREKAEDSPAAGLTTDTVTDRTHEDITWDLIRMVSHDADLRALLEKSIAQAHEMNPDPDTNPVKDLDSYYTFIDRICRSLPWQISPSENYSSLYDRIDQGMGCLYFVCDQPLKELEEKDYYHNSLMYHEPFRSWFIEFLSVSGQFLSSEASWNDTFYQNALANPDFHLADDLYEGHENWKSFNDFFARKLKDASRRPIAAPDDACVVTSPADAVPQGVWMIDDQSKVITDGNTEQAALAIKSGTLTDVSVLLGCSKYADAFAKGSLTHAFLDINDYHRYHFPVSGTVKEAFVIPQDDAPGGVITWDQETGRYKEYFSETFGWQSIETRGVVVMETPGGGLVAVIPVGMCQVSSVNFEASVVPGATVSKGDPLGYFLFGGSDIVMLFSSDLHFTMTARADEHLEMGQAYGTIEPE